MTLFHRFFFGILIAGLSVSIPTNYLRAEKLFVFNKRELENLLPKPWKEGQAIEGDLVLVVQMEANRKQRQKAINQDEWSFWNFDEIIGKKFNKTKLPNTALAFEAVRGEVSKVVKYLKDFYRVNRPYQADARIDGKKLKSQPRGSSYPSGHSTHGMFWALLLSEFRPDLKEKLLAHGREIGWHRIVVGAHYPSDVHTGFYLGSKIAERYLSSDAFKKMKSDLEPEWRQAGLLQ